MQATPARQIFACEAALLVIWTGCPGCAALRAEIARLRAALAGRAPSVKADDRPLVLPMPLPLPPEPELPPLAPEHELPIDLATSMGMDELVSLLPLAPA